MIQILPWIITISSTGRPADRNVNTSTMITNRADRTLIKMLSPSKEAERS